MPALKKILIQTFFLMQAVALGLPFLILSRFGYPQALAFFVGAELLSLSLLLIIVVWNLAVLKKSVALAVALVVLKVPVLGGLIWFALETFQVRYQFDAGLWLVAGVAGAATIMIAGMVRAFYLV